MLCPFMDNDEKVKLIKNLMLNHNFLPLIRNAEENRNMLRFDHSTKVLIVAKTLFCKSRGVSGINVTTASLMQSVGGVTRVLYSSPQSWDRLSKTYKGPGEMTIFIGASIFKVTVKDDKVVSISTSDIREIVGKGPKLRDLILDQGYVATDEKNASNIIIDLNTGNVRNTARLMATGGGSHVPVKLVPQLVRNVDIEWDFDLTLKNGELLLTSGVFNSKRPDAQFNVLSYKIPDFFSAQNVSIDLFKDPLREGHSKFRMSLFQHWMMHRPMEFSGVELYKMCLMVFTRYRADWSWWSEGKAIKATEDDFRSYITAYDLIRTAVKLVMPGVNYNNEILADYGFETESEAESEESAILEQNFLSDEMYAEFSKMAVSKMDPKAVMERLGEESIIITQESVADVYRLHGVVPEEYEPGIKLTRRARERYTADQMARNTVFSSVIAMLSNLVNNANGLGYDEVYLSKVPKLDQEGENVKLIVMLLMTNDIKRRKEPSLGYRPKQAGGVSVASWMSNFEFDEEVLKSEAE